ncbi:hypothetical protein DXG01_015162 [Tephrocybe rancida]|nr:hypothetical protein DXG01_015162 [Tephrocybe rancida]
MPPIPPIVLQQLQALLGTLAADDSTRTSVDPGQSSQAPSTQAAAPVLAPLQPAPTLAPPVLQPYQPTQVLLQPSQLPPPGLLPLSQQPFLPMSMAHLGGHLNTTQVNQARLASSASSNNCRQVQLPPRTSHNPSQSIQGASSQTPSLVSRPDAKKHCFVEGAAQPTLRVLFNIYPPLIYSHVAALEQFGLIKYSEILASTPLNTVIHRLSEELEQSQHQYRFQPSQLSLLVHEGPALQLLAPANKGTCSRRDGQIPLQPVPTTSGLTLDHLANDRSKFNLPLCIEGGNHFIIHFATHDMTVLMNYSANGFLTILQIFQPHLQKILTAAAEMKLVLPGPPLSINITSSTQASPNAPARQTSFLSAHTSLPQMLWDPSEAWISPMADQEGLYTVDSLASNVYENATSGTALQRLAIRGHDIHSLAISYLNMLEKCGQSDDYSLALSPNQHFTILDDDGRVQSFGQGIEQEAIYTAF